MSLDLAAQVKRKLLLSSIIKKSVELRANGARFLALCPFHQEKTPSFQVRDDLGRFKCFGCGASGDIFEFLMRLRGLSFKEAVLELADEAGIVRPELKSPAVVSRNKNIVDANKVAHRFFVEQLREKSLGLEARRYLVKERKLNVRMIEQAALGFGGASNDDFLLFLKKHGISTEFALAAGLLKKGPFSLTAVFLHRIIFPIRTSDGTIIAFGGRSFLPHHDVPKYVNTHGNEIYEKRKCFYGLFESRAAVAQGKVPCLVEGYFDAMAMWAIGIPALALCGTALSIEHARIIRRMSSRLLLALDQDAAGLSALKKALVFLYSLQIQSSVVVLNKKDPGEFLVSEELGALADYVAAPTDALCYVIDHIHGGGHSDIANRIARIDELLPILKSISRPLIRRQYVVYLANKLHEDPSLLWMELERRKKLASIEEKSRAEDKKSPGLSLSPHERLLAPIFLKHPALKKEALSLKALVSEPFLDFFITEGNKDKSLEHLILKASEEGPSLILEEAQAVIEAIKSKAKQKRTKEALSLKRQLLQQAEKVKDFSLILKSLKEHSQVLAENKVNKINRVVASNKKPCSPSSVKSPGKGYIRKAQDLTTEAGEEEGWY